MVLCANSTGCQGVTVGHGTQASARVSCYRRSAITPDACDTSSTDYDTWWMPRYYDFGHAVATLNDGYSRRLYGTSGQLNASSVRILWPGLLTDDERGRLRVLCQAPALESEPGPALYYMAQFLQHNALWVHWASSQLGAGSLPDHTWAEITHYHYTGEEVGVRTPMWFFSVPGSGVRLNIGRSARMGMLTGGDTGGTLYQAHLALMRGDITQAGALLDLDLTSYDSVQFPNYHAPSWRGERYTEIVMVQMFNEGDYINEHLPQMRCGPVEALRACTTDDEAIRQQSSLCSGSTGDALRSIFIQSACPEPEWYNFG